MKEAGLTREFSKREVQRMRNILTKNFGDKTQIQSGYEKDKKDHKEGDIWEENGKQWTIKNGLKQTYTKYDSFKKLVILPWKCPKCSKAMSANDINKKMYSIHGVCFDCVIEFEHQIRKEGKWEEYEKGQIKMNQDLSLKDFESALDAWFLEKDSFVTEAGDIESWEGGDKEKLYKEVKQWIQETKNK